MRSAVPGTTVLPSVDASSAHRLLRAAVTIGDRLVTSAQWSNGRCSWFVTKGDPSDPWSRRAVQAPAGPFLYQGTAGIALYLITLAQVTGDARYRTTADAALRNALGDLSHPTANALGFFCGWTGVAYVLARHGRATATDEFSSALTAVLKRALTNRRLAGDVISGAAGAIPILLILAKWLENEDLSDAALELAENVLRAARQWPRGISWRSVAGSARDLTGLAHGAAGYGYALLEAYTVAGNELFLHGAEQAFEYERQFFDEETGNWPDFRNLAAAKWMDEARRGSTLDSRSTCPPYVTARMLAWCHGAPGIGLTRFRAYEVTGAQQYLDEALAALHSTSRTHSGSSWNFSLCHGAFGNDALLLHASAILKDPAWAMHARTRALSAIERYEESPSSWPSGTLGGGYDASFMLGEAGIGYHLLALVDNTLPSILLPTTAFGSGPRVARSLGPDNGVRLSDSVVKVRVETVNEYFAASLRRFDLLRPGHNLRERVLLAPAGRHVEACADGLAQMILNEPDARVARLLEDASSVDRSIYALKTSVMDFTDTLRLNSAADASVDWEHGRFILANSVRVLNQTITWDSWNGWNDGWPTELLTSKPIIVQRVQDSVRIRPISPLALVVLTALQGPQTFPELLERLIADGHVDPHRQLSERVRDQVRRAYLAGVVTFADFVPPIHKPADSA